MSMPAEKTAIVLIEPQNDFLSPGGTMYAHIADQLAERGVIGNLQALLAGARAKGIKVFYVPFHSYEKGFPELKAGGPAVEGLRGVEMDMVADWGTGAWLRGTPGPEIITELTPEPGDIVIEGKKTLDAFHSTALDYLLRANEIEHVAMTGFHTNWCVESTARSAYDKGYRVTVLADCTATDTEEEQSYAERIIFPRIGKVMTSTEFLAGVV
ncbi:cysteine hydrolase family protein [Cellulomonas sp. KRMCY2]|uniref:cysteine hydrolase family protein n=1 Tax=Cellulomonas sp. KRMCY2 TaxID=1304865 RepID=UPI0004BCC28D|nr:isochorismatase family cysteine hydrolase [Cellulomonas sp. KRMCY2]